MKHIKIYTDGAYSSKSMKGGWGYLIVRDSEIVKERYGVCSNTTSNAMELYAAIYALNTMEGENKFIHIYTDSQYLHKGMTEWVQRWQRMNWKTSSGSLVKNRVTWERLIEASKGLNVKWFKVKSHSGDVLNDRADTLAHKGG